MNINIWYDRQHLFLLLSLIGYFTNEVNCWGNFEPGEYIEKKLNFEPRNKLEKATAVSGCQLSRREETSSGKLAFALDRRTITQIFLPFKTTHFPAVLKTFAILAFYTSVLFRTIPWILGQFMGLYTTYPTSLRSQEKVKPQNLQKIIIQLKYKWK